MDLFAPVVLTWVLHLFSSASVLFICLVLLCFVLLSHNLACIPSLLMKTKFHKNLAEFASFLCNKTKGLPTSHVLTHEVTGSHCKEGHNSQHSLLVFLGRVLL